MRIGYIQMNCRFGKVKENVESVLNVLGTRAADLFVLPELFTSGYVFTNSKEVSELSENIPDGPTCKLLTETASAQSCYIVGGLAEKDNGKFFNSAVVIGPEGVLLHYRKTHLFSDERKWFAPGDTGFKVCEVNTIRIGVMICFDWIFPESARTLALKGADIICHPANLVMPYCQKAMTTRTLENGVFAVTANRIGTEKRGGTELTFTGGSQIVDPRGTVLQRAGVTEEAVGIVEINPYRARDKIVGGDNHLFESRRTNMYQLDT